jgi:tetrapyrrole methylase family protein/MazG family protein
MDNSLEKIVKIMHQLRGPNGCPWDKEQDHMSIRNYMIEEVYEVIDAIEANNPEYIKEELGDLLFQIIFHCQIGKEQNCFDIQSVLEEISDKMMRRHPHVFGGNPTNDVNKVLIQWDEIKKTEKNQQNRISALDGIPKHLPALMHAQKALTKAHQEDILPQTSPEDTIAHIDRLWNQYKKNSDTSSKQELGLLLLQLAHLANLNSDNAEELLKKEIKEFSDHFKEVEKTSKSRSKGTLG